MKTPTNSSVECYQRCHPLSLPCNPTRRRGAFTLIEVVLGLVLMATLLVGILLAIGRHQHIHRLSAERNAAAELADNLLTDWFASPQGVPLSGYGTLPSMPRWSWRTSVVANRTVVGRVFPVVELEIFSSTPSPVGRPALLSIEILQSRHETP